jgi:hypothetical protein
MGLFKVQESAPAPRGGRVASRFVPDSPLEEDGFEPSVPPGREVLERWTISTRWVLPHGGTEGSNPSSSSGESSTNPSRHDLPANLHRILFG